MHPSPLWSVGVSSQQECGSSNGGNSRSGRKRGQHNSTAIKQWKPSVNYMKHQGMTSYSGQQNFYGCGCGRKKHAVFVSVRVANHHNSGLRCRACERNSSKWEDLLYCVLDAEQSVEMYAAEACSLAKPARPVVCGDKVLCVERKKWDVMLAKPHGLLIEVQGEGHSQRLVTKRNNTDGSLAERLAKDSLYADEAIAQGWSVLWLCVQQGITRLKPHKAKWSAKLKEAVAHVKAGGEPRMFVA